MTLGLIAEPVQWLADPNLTLIFCMLLTVWTGVGFYMVIFLAGLQNIPEELYDAAMIDGCNNFQKHWHISVPGLRPQITFVGVISSLAALNVFSEPFILYGPNGGILDSGTTVVLYLWRVAFRLNNAGYASAVAMGLLVITLGFSILQIRLIERGTEAN
jgi:ABC-type sugar transport system permease subunit